MPVFHTKPYHAVPEFVTLVHGGHVWWVGCLVLDLNVVPTYVILCNTGEISSDIVLLVPIIALVLKMLYNRSAHLSVCTVQLFTRKSVYGDILCIVLKMLQ